MDRFDIASAEEILTGKTTDIYFNRTEEVLTKAGITKHVTMEIAQKGMPDVYPYGIFTGLSAALQLLEGKPVDVWAIPEGAAFGEDVPVMNIEGNYLDFGVHETSLLGFICHCSGISTRASLFKMAAGNARVLSFGARRSHPALSAIIDKYAFIGGCDGFSVTLAEELIGEKASGTVPHALILQVGSTAEAMKLFDLHVDESVPRVALVDTFNDERFETLAVAELLKDRLAGIRLDTPGSRRGSMKKIAEEVRWELDLRGFEHVKIFASGGLDEDDVIDLKHVVEGFGIGTSISNAKVLDYSADIVTMDGKPYSKKGKHSGLKQAVRCTSCPHMGFAVFGTPAGICPHCGASMEVYSRKVMENGRIITPAESPKEIRSRVLGEIERVRPLVEDRK